MISMTSWFMSSQNFSEQKSFKSIKPSSFQDFFCSVEINEASSISLLENLPFCLFTAEENSSFDF